MQLFHRIYLELAARLFCARIHIRQFAHRYGFAL